MNQERASFSTEIEVHLRDVDTGHHVNNAVLVAYLEEARIAYLRELVDYRNDEPFIVVASLEMDFLNPVGWGETITVAVWISDIGESSFCMEYRLRSGETDVATASTWIVTYDLDSGESIPLPPLWKSRLESDNSIFLREGSDT